MPKKDKGKGPLDIFVGNVIRRRRKGNKKTVIEVLDGEEIKKQCGKGYLVLFMSFLISAECEKFIFVFRPKEKSFWYSINRGGIAVNFAYSPDKEKFKASDKDALNIECELEGVRV